MSGRPETFATPMPREVLESAARVMALAHERDLKLSIAESCTGGLLAALLTDVEGDAHAFERGFVTYTDQSKQDLLSVPAALIAEHSAVSAQVAMAMATGALFGSQGHIALSTTGFAGPGAKGEESGLVYFGLARPDRPAIAVERHFHDGGRAAVRRAAAAAGLAILEAALRGAEDFDA